MNGNTIRSLSAALAIAALVGLAQPGMATETDPEQMTPQSLEEEALPASLESLQRALADALATLDFALGALGYIEQQLAALREAQAEAGRKQLTFPIPLGLSRSTEASVYSVEAGERAITDAREATHTAQELPVQIDGYIAFLEAEIQRIETALQEAECVPPCTLNDELAALRANLEYARAEFHAAQAAVAEAESELARRIDNPGVIAGLLPGSGYPIRTSVGGAP